MEKRGKVIFVTGSTGFLGSAITRRLLVAGYRLRLLIRKRDNGISPISFGWEGAIKEVILGNQSDDHIHEQYSKVGDRVGTDNSLYDLFLRMS